MLFGGRRRGQSRDRPTSVARVDHVSLAAIPGLVDWLTITDPAVKKIGNSHLLLNVAALILFSVSLYLRMKNYGASLVGFHLKIPFAVSVVGWALMAISASLGGKLVYEHRMGVNEP